MTHNKNYLLMSVVQNYINDYAPELAEEPISIHLLDGPPNAPRYAASAETCPAETCPCDIAPALAQAGQCPVLNCPLRCSLRLLLDRHDVLVSARRSGVRWH